MSVALAEILKASLDRNSNVIQDEESDPEPEMEPWVDIQRSTFTNWANDKLRMKDVVLTDIRKVRGFRAVNSISLYSKYAPSMAIYSSTLKLYSKRLCQT